MAPLLLFLGYPLHAPGKKDQLRDVHLYKIEIPMLFFAGTRDQLCDLELLKEVLSRLKASCELEVIEGGDHSFNVPKACMTDQEGVYTRIERFDLKVLGAYTERDLSRIRTLDLLAEIHAKLGFRLSLAHLSEVNFGESKSGDGLQSLRWWKEGRLDLIEAYCRKDVEMTRRLWELGRDRGYLLYRGRAGDVLRLPVGWGA